MIEVRVPGKVHLIGEHSVVYGYPAIIASIALRTSGTFTKAERIEFRDRRFDQNFRFWDFEELKEFGTKSHSQLEEAIRSNSLLTFLETMRGNEFEGYTRAALGTALNELKLESGFRIEIDSEIPVGAGLGSSAAFAICLVRGLALTSNQEISQERENEIAFLIEKLAHGLPSGGDNSTCCYGGLVRFQKTASPSIQRLKDALVPKNFVIIHTGRPKKTTGQLVQQIRELPENLREDTMKALGETADKMEDALARGEAPLMRDLMNQAQELLAKLTVSTPTIDLLTSKIREIGGGAKISGAGGGGVVLAQHEDLRLLLSTISKLELNAIPVELGVI